MAKLTRVTGKVFGATADSSGSNPEIGQFGSAKAGTYNGTGDVATIQSLPAWNNGWIDAVTPTQQYPALPEMTGVHKVLSHQSAYILQEGIPEYDAGTTYYANSICKGLDNNNNLVLYKSLVDNNVGNALTDTTKWEELQFGGGGRNIGEIVASTIPLTDAGLHLLDGALIQGSGVYSDFVDYIADLYDSGDYDDIFDTEANWQTAVTTYGVCGKFVYDSVNNTVRLPKITGFTEGTIDPTTVGDLVEAGLPNIAGYTRGARGDSDIAKTAPFYSYSSLQGMVTSGSVAGTSLGFDLSLSNSIYGNSNTVQPQSIKVLYYIVVATSTKTEIQVDIDEIATDLNGKMDVDMTNMNASASAKNTINGWFMPDYTAGVSVTSDVRTTATTDCFVSCWCSHGSEGVKAELDIFDALDNIVCKLTNTGGRSENNGYYASVSAFVPKGYKFTIEIRNTSSYTATCYPLKGAS